MKIMPIFATATKLFLRLVQKFASLQNDLIESKSRILNFESGSSEQKQLSENDDIIAELGSGREGDDGGNANNESTEELSSKLEFAEKTIVEFQNWTASAQVEMQNNQSMIAALQTELTQVNDNSIVNNTVDIGEVEELREKLIHSTEDREQLWLQLANERRSNASDLKDLSDQMQALFRNMEQ